jgi:small subunit ribosomal protein S4
MEHKVVPEWLSLDIPKMEGRVLTLPTREEIDASLNEQLVVEFYSR